MIENRVIRDNAVPVDFEPSGYLDKHGTKDDYLIVFLWATFHAGLTYYEIADQLHSMKYATSKLYKLRITNSNVCKFFNKWMDLRRTKHHEKPDYKNQNHIIHREGRRKKKYQSPRDVIKVYEENTGVKVTEDIVSRIERLTQEQRISLKMKLDSIGVKNELQ